MTIKQDYIFRRAESDADAVALRDLFSQVFHPDDIGVLAETIYQHLPGMKKRYWFIAETRQSGQVAAGFALIPWVWEFEGLRLKVAEMGIVGTLEEHRRRGLMRVLNKEFDQTLADEGFHLAIIQGIPGFYDQFGYSYALPLENHVNLPLHLLPEAAPVDGFAFRLATQADIPFLMLADQSYRARFELSAYRDEAHWSYLLGESLKTEYGSEFWIMEHEQTGESAYCRIPQDGFGKGLIISEISEDISAEALESLFSFCRRTAIERDKPYLRLNLHNDSTAARTAVAMGAKPGRPYAWQIKIADPVHFLTHIQPLLERRLRASSFKGVSGRLRLNFFRNKIDLLWEAGRLAAVGPAEGDSRYTFSINADLFPALALGHRTWQELGYIRGDIYPHSPGSALLVETLFPARASWIHEQY